VRIDEKRPYACRINRRIETRILRGLRLVAAERTQKEIIVVDDGSTDGTREKLAAWHGRDGVRVIFHDRNLGKGRAVRTAMDAAEGDVLIIQDADLEYDPNEYPRLIKPIQDSWSTGKPIEWIKIHNLPNYVYFNHSAHVNHGVGCVECHGRIDRMDVVFQASPLSMGWCLDCHRAPESRLRPRDVRITDMEWKHPSDPQESAALGAKLRQEYQLHDVTYMTSCSTCHR